MIPRARAARRHPGDVVDTIAESPGGSSSPARKRLASATSCAWIASIPSSSRSSSAGAAPTQLNHAGEVSSRRALDARRSGGPKWSGAGPSPAHQPGASGRTRSSSSSPSAINAVPRGARSHLYAAHATASKRLAPNGSQPQAWVASTTVSAPWRRAAAVTASTSASSPVAD